MKKKLHYSLLFLLILTTSSSRGGDLFKIISSFKEKGLFSSEAKTPFSVTESKNIELSRSLSSYQLLVLNKKVVQQITDEQPNYLKINLPNPEGSGIITLELIKKEIYTGSFKLLTSRQSNEKQNSFSNYQGIVSGNSESVAAFSFSENDVMGIIATEKGNYNLGKLSKDNLGNYIFYNDANLKAAIPFQCGVTSEFSRTKPGMRLNNPNTTTSTKCVNFYWETDQDIYTDKLTVPAVSTYINGIFNQVSAEYANDGITAKLNTLYVWNSIDPYVGPASNDYLDQFGTNRTSFTGDLATLLGYNGGGGVAWLDVLCDPTLSYHMAYTGINANYNNIPTYSWTVEVVSHEQGHNLGSSHTHDCVWNGNSTAIDGCGPNAGYASDPTGCAQGPIPAKGTIMSYCHLPPNTGINLALGFGTQPKTFIQNRIAASSCLTICSATNDDPCTATSLTVGTSCSPVSGDNTAATNSTVPVVSCDGNGDGDVWFSAVVPASGVIEINTMAGTLTDMGMALYSGTCTSLALINCYAGGNATTPTMPRAIVSSQTAGSTIWIRMWDVNNDEVGTFQICAVNPCSASVSITGATSACSANVTQLCASPSFTGYSWTGGGTTQCITPASSATYTVTVTDANGCTASASKSFTINNSPTVTLTGATAACLNTNPAICTGTTYTQYAWSNGGTTQCINPPSSGTYSVTVTNASGCTGTASKTVTIYPNFTPAVTGADSSCTSLPGTLCSSTGNSYSWSSGETTQCINPSTSGNYVVTVTNANGCTATASKSTIVYTNPTAAITGPTSACNGSTIQLCANSGSYTYAWSNAATASCINITVSGSYTTTITDTHGCTSSASQTVTYGSSLSVNITGPSQACPNTGAQLCADAGFANYLWSSGQTTACITPTLNGTYTVRASDNTGCSATSSATINFYSVTPVTVSGPSSGCANSFPQLCASSGYPTYLWSSSQTTQCITPPSPGGSFSVIATDANGCTSSASQSLTVLNNPSLSISGPGIVCPGTPAMLCASTNGNAISWSTAESTACISVPDSGSYTATASASNGCTSTLNYHLNYYSVPTPVISGPTTACFGTSAQLCAPTGYTIYSWSSGQTTRCINVTTAGNYIVTLTDVNGCTSTANHSISFGSNLNLSITGPAGICFGQSIQLCATTVGTTQWSNGSTSQCITITSGGPYTVTVTDANGCSASASRSITSYAAFSASITGPSTACYGTNVQYCSPSGTGYQYSWSTGETTRCINTSTSGIYTVTITNLNGCTASSSQGLTIFSQLNSTITGPTSLCIGAVGQLCAPTGSSLYQWSTGSTARCISVNSTGNYTVTITGANGCTASNTAAVTFSNSITTTITGSHTPCAGSILELCVPIGYTDYAWNTGATTECISVTSNGIYSVTIHDAVGCVGNDTQLVSFSPIPPVSITGPTNICKGAIETICATQGYPAYSWNGGGTQSCITVSTAGNYSVIVTDANGCTNSSTIGVSETNINPVIAITPSGLVATPTGNQYTYSWYYNGATFTGCTGDTCTPVHTGDYTVVINDQNWGCTDSATIYYFSVGIAAEPSLEQIKLFPNPILSNWLNVEFDFSGTEKISLQITNALGQQLVQSNFVKVGSMTKQINCSDLAAGIYVVNIKGEKWQKSWKIVKP